MKQEEYKLQISDLRLDVYLGCNVTEQEAKQTVRVDFSIQLPKLPLGAKTDQLRDTICYSKAVEYIRAFIAGEESCLAIQQIQNHQSTKLNSDLKREKRFNLIEHLCAEIYQGISLFLKNNRVNQSLISVTVYKQNAPVIGVYGDISFTITLPFELF